MSWLVYWRFIVKNPSVQPGVSKKDPIRKKEFDHGFVYEYGRGNLMEFVTKLPMDFRNFAG